MLDLLCVEFQVKGTATVYRGRVSNIAFSGRKYSAPNWTVVLISLCDVIFLISPKKDGTKVFLLLKTKSLGVAKLRVSGKVQCVSKRLKLFLIIAPPTDEYVVFGVWCLFVCRHNNPQITDNNEIMNSVVCRVSFPC